MGHGITRVDITDSTMGRGGWRFEDSRRLWDTANKLYRSVLPGLLPGEDVIKTSKDEYDAGYDSDLGIDVFLRFSNGTMLTMQEKFLFTKYNTITVEWHQDRETDERGDWFDMKCQLYFVGYDYPKTCRLAEHKRRFSSWVLLDWPRVVFETARSNMRWQSNINMRDGARASFKFIQFDKIPPQCIVSRSNPNEYPAHEG